MKQNKISFYKSHYDAIVIGCSLAGMYVSVEMKIGNTRTSRPYSICSAPYPARQSEHPFIAITVRNGRPGQGFAANFMYDSVKPGDHFTVHVPFGFFYYEPLRDSKNIVALAGGSDRQNQH